MKKILLKLFIIAILMELFVVANVYADENDNFVVHAKEAMEVNAGETIDVPIILSNIEVNDIQKGIMGLSFKIEYDEQAFVLEKYENGSYFQRFVGTKDSMFNEEDLVATIYCNAKANDYLDEVTELGTIKLKAKEGIKTGFYNLTIAEVKGGNLDSTNMNITSTDAVSPVYVKGIDEEEQGPEAETTGDEELLGEKNSTILYDDKEIVAKYEQNKKGTSLKITIDAEKGTEVSKILINDTEMTLKDGVFTAEVEPYMTYTLKFYDAAGNFKQTKPVTILNLEEEQTETDDIQIPEEEKKSDEDEKKDDDKKSDEEKKDNENSKDDQKEETNNTNEQKDNQEKNNVDKSAQTGDVIGVAVAVLIVASATLGTSAIVKNEFE